MPESLLTAETASECDVLAVFMGSAPSVELTEKEIALALRHPAAAKANSARRIWPEDVVAAAGGIGGNMETVVLETAENLIELLEGFRDPRHSSLM